MTGRGRSSEDRRMVRIFVTASLLWLAVAAAAPAQEGRALFNGKNLDGWIVEGPSEYRDNADMKPLWSVHDGLLVCEGRDYGFLRYHKQQFGDFVLHVEYRTAPGGNSGIGIRTVPYDPRQTD